jgi:hypothetical protein
MRRERIRITIMEQTGATRMDDNELMVPVMFTIGSFAFVTVVSTMTANFFVVMVAIAIVIVAIGVVVAAANNNTNQGP